MGARIIESHAPPACVRARRAAEEWADILPSAASHTESIIHIESRPSYAFYVRCTSAPPPAKRHRCLRQVGGECQAPQGQQRCSSASARAVEVCDMFIRPMPHISCQAMRGASRAASFRPRTHGHGATNSDLSAAPPVYGAAITQTEQAGDQKRSNWSEMRQHAS